MKPVTISETSDKKYWIKRYEFEGMEAKAKAVALMPNGDIVIAGSIKSKGKDAKSSGLVARLDREGNVKWVRILGGSKGDWFTDVKIASNGDVIVAGYTESFGAGYDNIWVLRLDENGNVKWQKTYGGKKWDRAYAIAKAYAVAVAPNDDIIVAGYTTSFGAGKEDVWVLRLDGNGNVKWQKTYGGSRDAVALAVAVAENGDVIVAGSTGSFGAGYGDFWVLRLDANGNVKWQKTYGGSKCDFAYAVTIAENGDIIVAGETESFGAGYWDAWVLRLDENGNVKWQKTYGGKKWDWASAVAITPNGDIIVAGGTESFGAGKEDVWVLRLDGNGNVKWQKTYGGSRDAVALAVAVAENGDVIVAGHTYSFGAGSYDFWVLRLPPNGELPDCNICQESNATIMDTQAVVKNTNCKVTVPPLKPGFFRKEYVKITNTSATIRTAVPKVEVLCEWSPEKSARGIKKPKPETGESLEVETPSKTEKSRFWEKPGVVKGFPSALLERYEPLEFLGEGGFACVYKAKRREDGKVVALKIPRIDEKTSGLFIKEVAAWYNLSHENIVRLYRADILPIPYLEMEFIEGIEVDGKLVRDLEKYPKPADEKTALKLITGIAKGLKHAHAKGIYHLDLKPLNVLLKSDLTPKITDWGLAKISARSSLSRHYGYSPLYAAPEQLDEETFGVPDHRTDIYQLGLIFYELLSGELPYKATSPGALVGKILYAKPKPISELKPKLKKFDGIFEKLLAKRKEERYQSVEEFLSVLESLGELEREKEELRKTSLAMRKSRSKEEFERLKRESIRKTVKIAILSARLNDKAELLTALDDLKFHTRENLDDLLNAIAQIEMLLKEGVPISAEVEERVKALVLRIEGEALR